MIRIEILLFFYIGIFNIKEINFMRYVSLYMLAFTKAFTLNFAVIYRSSPRRSKTSNTVFKYEI